MKRNRKLAVALLATLGLGALFSAKAEAVPFGVTFTSYGNTLVTPGARNAGFAFSVGAAGVNITSLSDYLNSGTSAQASTTIRLYKYSLGYGVAGGTVTSLFTDTITTALGVTPAGGSVSTAVLTATPTAITYYVDTLATPITLSQGTYYLSADGATNAIVPYEPGGLGTGGLTFDPLIGYVGALYQNGVTFPTSNSGAIPVGNTGAFNVNLGLAAVPEPASIGLGIAGATIALGRRRRRSI